MLTELALRESVKGVWTKHTDPNSGVAYYYDTITKASSWEQPPDFVEATLESIQASIVAKNPKWSVSRDPKSGRFYYFNKENGQSVWERPADFSEAEYNPAAAASRPQTVAYMRPQHYSYSDWEKECNQQEESSEGSGSSDTEDWSGCSDMEAAIVANPLPVRCLSEEALTRKQRASKALKARREKHDNQLLDWYYLTDMDLPEPTQQDIDVEEQEEMEEVEAARMYCDDIREMAAMDGWLVSGKPAAFCF